MAELIMIIQFLISMAGFVIAMWLVSLGLRLAKPIIKGEIIQAIWHLEVALGLAISSGAITNLALYVEPMWAGVIPWLSAILMLMVIFYSINAYNHFKRAVVVKGKGIANTF